MSGDIWRAIEDLRKSLEAVRTRERAQFVTGTFTPTYYGSSSAGVTTYSAQVGVYTRIGDRVDFTLHVNWTAVTGTGNALVGGLPFTNRTLANYFVAPSLWYSAITYAAGNGVQAYLANNSAVLILTTAPASNTATADLAIEAAGILIISGTYFI